MEEKTSRSNIFEFESIDVEMEENAREVEQDLRQTIDLLQNQIHDVNLHIFVFISEKNKRFVGFFFTSERTTNRTTSIFDWRSRTNDFKVSRNVEKSSGRFSFLRNEIRRRNLCFLSRKTNKIKNKVKNIWNN